MVDDSAVLRSGMTDPTSSMDVEQTVRSQTQFLPSVEGGIHYYLQGDNRISGTLSDCVIDLGRSHPMVTKIAVSQFAYYAMDSDKDTAHVYDSVIYLHIEEFAHNTKNIRVPTDTGVTRVDQTAVLMIPFHNAKGVPRPLTEGDMIQVNCTNVHQLHISFRWQDNSIVNPLCWQTGDPLHDYPWALDLVLYGNPDLAATR